jgi:hypothetical protein
VFASWWLLNSSQERNGEKLPELSGKGFRNEFKYEINPLQYQVIKKKVALLLKTDPFAGPEGGYHVRNLYFDDFRNTALWEKLAGVYERKKYRMRIYNGNDETIKFERKAKLGQYVFKDVARLTREEADRIIDGDVDFLSNSENPLLRTLYVESRQNLLRPVVIVEYYREAFYEPVSNVRITFDIGLRTGLSSVSLFDPNLPTMAVTAEPNVIMEIKFGNVFPHYIQGLFPINIQPRLAMSKFVLCRVQQMRLVGGSRGVPNNQFGLPFALCPVPTKKEPPKHTGYGK